MPASYAIDPDRALVVSRGWGVLTDADVRDHYRLLAEDPRFKPTFRQLADIRETSAITASSTTIWAEGRRNVFVPGARRAFVVATQLQYGMVRMFATYGENMGQTIAV